MGKRTEQKRKERKVNERFGMYTTPEKEAENNPDWRRAQVSQDNPRDIVEAIDQLICLRLKMSSYWSSSSHEEEVELLKRKITDYLLVTDPRAGVFRKPE